MKSRVASLSALVLGLGCSSGGPGTHGNATGGSGAEETGGSTGGASASGGSSATGGRGGGASGGAGGSLTGGTGGEAAPDAATRDAPPSADSAPPSDAPLVSPPAGGQGPKAEGTIVYDQDFEKDMAGLSRSPPDLPASRAQIVDDPLAQRGKVLRIQWLPGDDFRSAPQFKPKNFVSNATAFHYGPGDRVSYAWGYMTESTYIGATLAQNITGGDPIWMIQGRDDGIMDMVPGLVRLPVKLEARKWYDFRAEVYYVAGAAGSIELFINGARVFSHQGGLPIGTNGHWDGGIYLTGFGVMGQGLNTPRTVYFSNLSVGKK
jgi:hypothetical protein